MRQVRDGSGGDGGQVTRTAWVLAGAALAVAASATVGLAVIARARPGSSPVGALSVNTATVEKGRLEAMVSLDGTLTYRARADGSPYPVINQASGTYTQLPDVGGHVGCGDVLYRVSEHPVLLLCGAVPAYRDLHVGDVGADVQQLNQNLHIDPSGDAFTSSTQQALEVLQHDKGLVVTGALAVADAVFVPEPLRIANLTAVVGGPAQPGVQALSATSDTLTVQVQLEPSQQGDVHQGDPARITLPGNRSVTGKVDRVGRVAQLPAAPTDNAAQKSDARDATIPAYISLDDPATAGGLDRAPVRVEITTTGVENALSVPVTAVVGKADGGYAVEVVRDGGRRELVPVKLGLFDTAGGRVEVTGDLREGDRVIVPSL